MSEQHEYFADLLAEIEMPSEGTLSRKLIVSDGVRAVLFAMPTGEELTEHTAPKEAIVHVLKGAADFIVEGQTRQLAANSWLRMAPSLPHSVKATEDLVFLLLLVG